MTMLREVHTENIVAAVKELCIRINFRLNADVVDALRNALAKEKSETGKMVLRMILENDREAFSRKMPLCQDTGMVVAYVEIGQNVRILGSRLEEAVNEGVKLAYKDAYLRKSMVNDPLERKNTGDNTPAMLHEKMVKGNTLSICLMAKGAGAENMSRLKMLKPSEGAEGVKEFVLDTVLKAGANPCPPVIVGVGVGGSFDTVAVLAKKALFRRLGSSNKNAVYSKMENELLKKINASGIGPQGLGGTTTALAVHVESLPCHIGALPVAVNLNCFTARHGLVEI